MSGEENLGPGVREIVELLKDGQATIDLRDVKPGDKLFIKIGETEDDYLNFTIIEPAKQNVTGPKDSARAWLPGCKLPPEFEDREKVKILIGGSCTYSPYSPMVTMLSIGKLTQGRSMVIWCEEVGSEDKAIIFKNGIIAMALIHEL
ncbi:MAG: hypothetical protein V1668_02715 [Patescibacteria group bacterium]